MDINRQERRAKALEQALAEAIGVSTADLERLDYTIKDQRADDGTVTGHLVCFSAYNCPRIMERIPNLVDARVKGIGFISLDGF